MAKSFKLEAGTIHMALVRDVQNTEEIRKKIQSGDETLRACGLVRPSLILDPIQLVVAANKSLLSAQREDLTTKSVITETLYNLSPSKNIRQSLVNFGIGAGDKDVLVFVVGDDDDFRHLEAARHVISGRWVDINELEGISDKSRIKKMYDIKDTESECFDLLDSVVSRIAVKKCL
ncbi:hypothetical protein AAG570_003307 [Ranatra chinensis]|uniref:Uncharacterized protein n=1 Tax=Ranatra chinensis TaxID=642074 RepID=A0ABD0YP98_9HEMI